MTKAAALLVFAAFQAHAAIPPRTPPGECKDRRVIEPGAAILSQPAEQAGWDCLDLSHLGKSDLIAVADKAPDVDVKLSQSILSRGDFIEVARAAGDKFTLEVDSARFNRVDMVELRRANVKTHIHSSTAGLNLNDMLEIAKVDGPAITVDVNGPTYTVDELRTLSKESSFHFVIDLAKSGISEDDARAIAGDTAETKITF